MRNPDGTFKKGVQFWKMRTTLDAHAVMKTPQNLQKACNEYFEWIADNPLTSEKVHFTKSGEVIRDDIFHPRAMTIWGISSYLGITSKTWYEWRKTRDDLKPVIDWAEEIIKEQKFSGAAAGLMNASIIARELGLADKQTIEMAVPQMTINPPSGEAPPEPPIHGE